MVLMRVGDDETEQFVAPLGNKAWIRHHHIHFWMFRPAETQTAINRQPLPTAAIEVQIHADLARSPEREEGKIVVKTGH
jgi:hypothetical protein